MGKPHDRVEVARPRGEVFHVTFSRSHAVYGAANDLMYSVHTKWQGVPRTYVSSVLCYNQMVL